MNRATRLAPPGASHTPGPWAYEVHELSEGFSAIVYGANGMRIGTDHLSESDARLIAASPTMLAALKWARGCVPFPSDCHAAIVAAIEEVEGGAS